MVLQWVMTLLKKFLQIWKKLLKKWTKGSSLVKFQNAALMRS
jgi:hypothetical protein